MNSTEPLDATAAALKCAPWPCEKNRAPTSFLLQDEAGNPGPASQPPRQRAGTGGRFLSDRLRRSGQTPVSGKTERALFFN